MAKDPNQAHEMTREERLGSDLSDLTAGRALVMEDIVSDDQARRALVLQRLEDRIVDFWEHLDEAEQEGAIFFHDNVAHDVSMRKFVRQYLDEMLSFEDDPIGQLAYAPGLPIED